MSRKVKTETIKKVVTLLENSNMKRCKITDIIDVRETTCCVIANALDALTAGNMDDVKAQLADARKARIVREVAAIKGIDLPASDAPAPQAEIEPMFAMQAAAPAPGDTAQLDAAIDALSKAAQEMTTATEALTKAMRMHNGVLVNLAIAINKLIERESNNND